ncbi:hypothetical protein B296_00030689 [Ensete ventricosum]|uniref:Uncharacterized protein n=1 Tax=Ensete ventricosum TaxID=4639 RepID=A0A426Z0T3_ENSVE|nr:hypothetical protein B296_00030689 [Ensete ventricosum]
MLSRSGTIATDLAQLISKLDDDEDEANPTHDIIRYKDGARGPWDHTRSYVTSTKDTDDIKGRGTIDLRRDLMANSEKEEPETAPEQTQSRHVP